MDLKSIIRDVENFPKEGVLFRDITTLLKDADAFKFLIDSLKASLEGKEIDLVIGPEARGFLIGSALSYALNAGFIAARKPGKLPCETNRYEYGLEYGSDVLEIHKDAIRPGQRVVIVDDLLATGGTALAAIRLAELAGAEVVGVRFAVELTDFDGRKILGGYDVESIVQY